MRTRDFPRHIPAAPTGHPHSARACARAQQPPLPDPRAHTHADDLQHAFFCFGSASVQSRDTYTPCPPFKYPRSASAVLRVMKLAGTAAPGRVAAAGTGREAPRADPRLRQARIPQQDLRLPRALEGPGSLPNRGALLPPSLPHIAPTSTFQQPHP